MKNIATIINWVKANKKKAAIALGVVLFGLLVIIGGEKEEVAATTATTHHLCSGVCNHGLGI